MKKRLLGIFLLIFSGNVLGDQHAAAMPTIYGQSYSLIVTNPVAVIAAMDAYRASPAAQAVARNTVLIQNVANGDNPSTHTINVFYQSAADMDRALAANATSRDAAVFLSTMRESTTIETENVFTVTQFGGNPPDTSAPGAVQYLIGLEVTEGAAFRSAFENLWNSDAIVSFPGGVYFGEVLGMGESKMTHFISFITADMATMMDAMTKLQSSAAMAEYVQEANSFRNYSSTSIGRQVKSWSGWTLAN